MKSEVFEVPYVISEVLLMENFVIVWNGYCYGVSEIVDEENQKNHYSVALVLLLSIMNGADSIFVGSGKL